MLPHPSDPVIHEPSIKDARAYVELAEQVNGPIPKPVDFAYIWGYEVPSEHIEFAHKLIEEAVVDIIYGHSSHHIKGIEVYQGKLILYGSGDFLNDYEGIPDYESFRNELALMYFAGVDPSTGQLVQMQMTPVQIKRFNANRASRADVLWLGDILHREGKKLGTQVEINQENTLRLRWD